MKKFLLHDVARGPAVPDCADEEIGWIKIPNRFASIGTAVDILVGRVHAALGCSVAVDDACESLRLALTEALNNAVEHGGLPEGTSAIHIGALRRAGTIEIRLQDSGRPLPACLFEQRDAPRLAVPGQPLEELPEGGWGWHIIRSSVDRVAYRRLGERNYLSLEIETECLCRG